MSKNSKHKHFNQDNVVINMPDGRADNFDVDRLAWSALKIAISQFPIVGGGNVIKGFSKTCTHKDDGSRLNGTELKEMQDRIESRMNDIVDKYAPKELKMKYPYWFRELSTISDSIDMIMSVDLDCVNNDSVPDDYPINDLIEDIAIGVSALMSIGYVLGDSFGINFSDVMDRIADELEEEEENDL